MYLVEWSFESGNVRAKVCESVYERDFWVAVATSGRALFILVSEVGRC
jgi:hypothetical protein